MHAIVLVMMNACYRNFDEEIITDCYNVKAVAIGHCKYKMNKKCSGK